VVFKPSAPSLPGSMLRTLIAGLGADLVLYVGFVTARYGLALAERARALAREGEPDA
jgi:hypothetical protein